MTQAPDLQREPLAAIYEAMTEVLEEAGAALERGDVVAAGILAKDVSILGRALGILGRRTDR